MNFRIFFEKCFRGRFVRSFVFIALLSNFSPLLAQKGDWLDRPYGSISNDDISLNALDVRDQHKEDIKRLCRELNLQKVEVITASDDFWYYSLQGSDGCYGVADQHGNVLLPAVYTTLNYCPGVSAVLSNLLYNDGKKNFNIPLTIPGTRPCFIASINNEYKILDLEGKVLREGMDKPFFYNYYLLTGTEQDKIQMRMREDSVAVLVVGAPSESPLHIYTLNGQEIQLPPTDIVEDDMRYYSFSHPFMEMPVRLDTTTKGSLFVDSDHRNARVKVDGVAIAQVPVTLSLSGTHNITVEDQKNYFYRGVEHLEVKPGERVERFFALKKMPPKTDFFLGFNYGVMSGGLGGMLGICKRWGGYARVLFCGASEINSSTSVPWEYSFNFKGFPLQKLVNRYSRSYTAGAMYRVNQYLYPYLGFGYAKYISGQYPETNFAPARIGGMVLDVGAIASYRFLFVSVGVSPMIAASEKKCANSYCDLHVGVGLKLHINRKR